MPVLFEIGLHVGELTMQFTETFRNQQQPMKDVARIIATEAFIGGIATAAGTDPSPPHGSLSRASGVHDAGLSAFTVRAWDVAAVEPHRAPTSCSCIADARA
jgi:hypothetical protein